MTVNKLIHETKLEMKRFPESEDAFPIPAGERLAAGLVTYVSGLPQPEPSQTMALTILPYWLCLSNKQEICATYALEQIRDVKVVQLPQFSTTIPAPDGAKKQVLRPYSLALALHIPNMRKLNYCWPFLIPIMLMNGCG
jgi:hypothetical protein